MLEGGVRKGIQIEREKYVQDVRNRNIECPLFPSGGQQSKGVVEWRQDGKMASGIGSKDVLCCSLQTTEMF